jgi:hypothetical protein
MKVGLVLGLGLCTDFLDKDSQYVVSRPKALIDRVLQVFSSVWSNSAGIERVIINPYLELSKRIDKGTFCSTPKGASLSPALAQLQIQQDAVIEEKNSMIMSASLAEEIVCYAENGAMQGMHKVLVLGCPVELLLADMIILTAFGINADNIMIDAKGCSGWKEFNIAGTLSMLEYYGFKILEDLKV